MPQDASDKDRLLARWLNDDLSEAEAEAWSQNEDRADYERILAATDRLAPPAYDSVAELNRLKTRRGRQAAQPTLHPRPRPLRRYGPWLAVAASLALLLTAWLLWPADQLDYRTANGETLVADLPDGSDVRLNAGSSLLFAETSAQRRATLTGEAFFEVQKSTIPFVVATEAGTVTVLGTSFNVYQRDDDLRVTCVTGSVRVAFGGATATHVLSPGESVASDTGGAVTEKAPSTAEELDWLEGRTVFSGRPLRAVIAALERQFDLAFTVEPGLDLSQTLRVNFPNDDADTALELVFGTLDQLTYERVGKRVILRRE